MSRCGRIPPDLLHEAIRCLVAHHRTAGIDPVRRFLANASHHGIDPTLCWAVYPDSHHARRHSRPRGVCLLVPGSGATGNLFLAPPTNRDDEQDDRVRVLEQIARDVPGVLSDRVRVLQALPEPQEHWATQSLRGAGFTHCGRLSYLRLMLARARTPDATAPPHLRVCTLDELGGLQANLARLERALEASYVQTLDCPELCGIRRTPDVLESHLATGAFDPSMWWLALHDDEPVGIACFNPLGDGQSVELVYIGLSPQARGQGLGATLMRLGIEASRARRLREMTCAVDARNEPALRLYERIGFRPFAQREAFVRTTAETA